MTRALFAFAAVFMLATPAGAEAGRYVLEEVEGGFISLDTETGAVSHCRKQDEHWRCEPVADAEAALHDEIARLAEENAALRQRLAGLPEPRVEPGTGPALELPSEEDLDRVLGIMEKFMRRFIEFARSLNEDPGRET
jgi:hypothetical protein